VIPSPLPPKYWLCRRKPRSSGKIKTGNRGVIKDFGGGGGG